jgi:hydroxyethylthiazole kinase
MALLGIAGEIAAEKMQAHGLGVGSMAVRLLDEWQLLDQATFEKRLRMEVAMWQG